MDIVTTTTDGRDVTIAAPAVDTADDMAAAFAAGAGFVTVTPDLLAAMLGDAEGEGDDAETVEGPTTVVVSEPVSDRSCTDRLEITRDDAAGTVTVGHAPSAGCAVLRTVTLGLDAADYLAGVLLDPAVGNPYRHREHVNGTAFPTGYGVAADVQGFRVVSHARGLTAGLAVTIGRKRYVQGVVLGDWDARRALAAALRG